MEQQTGSRGHHRYITVQIGAERPTAPALPACPPADLSSFDGLRFGLRPRPNDVDLALSLGLTDQAGACWQVNVPIPPDQPCLLLFQDLKWEWWSALTASLDLRRIAQLKLHCSSPASGETLVVELADFEAVKFK